MNQWNEKRQREFESLLTDLLEGEAAPQTRHAMNEIMREHREARDLYLHMMALHAQLHACHSESESAQSDPRPQRSFTSTRWERIKQLAMRPTPLSIGIAAASIAALLSFLAAIAPPVYRAVRGTPDPDAEVLQPEFALARVTGLHEAEFDSSPLRRGAQLRGGDSLQLASGLVEIRYATGEQLIVQGPCALMFDRIARDATFASVFVEKGRLTASVPQNAVGFTVRTPSATVVDRGTQFGVLVRDGETEVHVIEGKVEARSLTAKRMTAVAAGEAYRFREDSLAPEIIEIASAEFTREIPGAASSRDPYVTAVLQDRPVGYWRLNDRGTNLAFNSAGRPHGMYRGGVELEAMARPSGFEFEEHCQSARFNGTSGYVEVEYSQRLNAEDFTLEAWVRLDRQASDYASIVTSRFAPTKTAGYTVYISPEGNWEFWTGNAADWSTLQGGPVRVDEWTHIAATYQRIRTHPSGVTSGIACFYVDGELVAKRDDMTYLPLLESSRPLRIAAGATEQAAARYYFPGQLADVAIYDRALRAEDIRHHYQQPLRDKE